MAPLLGLAPSLALSEAGVFANSSRIACGLRPLSRRSRAASEPSTPNIPKQNVFRSDPLVSESFGFFHGQVQDFLAFGSQRNFYGS
jgi:hypothetical protein